MLFNESERSLSQISGNRGSNFIRFKAMYGTFQSSILQESAYLALSSANYARFS